MYDDTEQDIFIKDCQIPRPQDDMHDYDFFDKFNIRTPQVDMHDYDESLTNFNTAHIYKKMSQLWQNLHVSTH
jgi:hypothetical protein